MSVEAESTLPHLNFRSFVQALKDEGDCISIVREIDPIQEAAAVTRLCYEHDLAAPLFENLKGAKNGLFRILGAPAGLRADSKTRYGRLARHLALPPDAHIKTILDKMVSAAHMTPVPPRLLASGSCKQNVLFGDRINLKELPSPLIHKDDGGRFIQTMGELVVSLLLIPY
jgi:UbiD family decarboxylase